MMQPTQLIFQGQWTHKKSRYSSPVDHRSLDDLCTSTHTMSQKLCARYTLGASYLYFKRNVEKLEVRVTRQVRIIGQKIRYVFSGFHHKVDRANWHFLTTLTEVSPCFFFSCEANARVYLTKTGHSQNSSQIVNCVVLYNVCVSCVVLCNVCV